VIVAWTPGGVHEAPGCDCEQDQQPCHPRPTTLSCEAQPRVEVASWVRAKPLWFPEGLAEEPKRYLPYCHFLNEADFEAVLTGQITSPAGRDAAAR